MKTWDGTKWVDCDWVAWTLKAAGKGAYRIIGWATRRIEARYAELKAQMFGDCPA
jgi:hypothetical protein